MKKVGVSVTVRYPGSSHGLTRAGDRWLLVDRIERIESPPQDRAATQGGR